MTTEPPRKKQDKFCVLVLRLDEDNVPAVDITDAVMDMYDIAVHSMDFGSGFLSTEEVGNLRRVGKAIGAEHFDYQHDKCLRCGHAYERHHKHSEQRDCWFYECDCKGFINGEEGVIVSDDVKPAKQ